MKINELNIEIINFQSQNLYVKHNLYPNNSELSWLIFFQHILE